MEIYILNENLEKKEGKGNRPRPIQYYIDSNGCWICISHKKDQCGYPIVNRLGFQRCHRYSYYLAKGDIPKGLVIRHTCDNPNCINPDHLILGTQTDNVEDIYDRDRRSMKEEKNPNFKDFDIEGINNDYQLGMKMIDILVKYGISKTHFYRLKKEGKIFKK